MKKLLLNIKGHSVSLWHHLKENFISTIVVLLILIGAFSYNIKTAADYQKIIKDMEKDHIEAYGLVQDQRDTILAYEDAMEKQSAGLTEQGQIINRLVTVLNQQKMQIDYQNKIIQELMKRLRDGGLLPDELPNNGKNRSEANWTTDESI